MRAVVCRAFGSHLDLVVDEVADPPRPGPGQVKLRVRAAGLNFADLLMIGGSYQEKPALPFSPGLEVAGEVMAVGPDVTRVAPGDRVLALLDHGGFAEQALARESDVHKLPAVREALERVLPRFGIQRVRTVQDVYLQRPLTSPTYWIGHRWRGPLAAAFQTTEHLYLPSSAHDVGWDAPLLERCARLSGPSLEVAVHPGSREGWRDEERGTLLRFAPAARAAGHELISWNAL